MPDIKTSMMIKRGFNMAEYLKEFIDGEDILAAETNANNNYLLDQIRDSSSVLTAKINSLTSQLNTNLQAIYPIGAIYLSANDVNPGTFLGGVWDRIAAGSTLLGAGTVQEYITTGMADGNPVETLTTSIYNVGDTGGERFHTLTIEEIPSHRHTVEVRNDGNPYAWEDKSSAADRQYWNSGYNSFAQQYNKIPSTADVRGGVS